MDIKLTKATLENAEELYSMQLISFKPLLEKLDTKKPGKLRELMTKWI